MKNIDLSPFKNKCVAVAVSGGEDSVALLHFLNCNQKKYGYTLKAVNVEHGIRGKNSIKDSLFVEKICQNYGIKCHNFKVDAPLYAKEQKLSLEAAARKLRYDCFYELIKTGETDFVATAHHLSDNAESVLLNLLRGTGLKGASGIQKNCGGIIRPFIDISKQQITDYIKLYNLEYVVDQTNFDDKFTRNFLRLNIFPKLKEIFPSCENALIRFAQASSQDDEFLQNLSKKLLFFEENCVKIEFCEQKPLFYRAAIFALKHLGAPFDYTFKHLDAMFNLQFKENGKTANLKKKVIATKDHNFIVLFKEKEKNNFPPMPFKIGTVKLSCDFAVKIEPINLSSKEFLNAINKPPLTFDLAKMPSGAVFRTRQTGDIFKSYGAGTKSLKKYLIDKKIPERHRDELFLIADKDNILAILGVEISDKIKVDNYSKLLYNIEITKGE